MSLQPGARLGPHEIVTPIGAGSMGEVYRAKDARLDHDVARAGTLRHAFTVPQDTVWVEPTPDFQQVLVSVPAVESRVSSR